MPRATACSAEQMFPRGKSGARLRFRHLLSRGCRRFPGETRHGDTRPTTDPAVPSGYCNPRRSTHPCDPPLHSGSKRPLPLRRSRACGRCRDLDNIHNLPQLNILPRRPVRPSCVPGARTKPTSCLPKARNSRASCFLYWVTLFPRGNIEHSPSTGPGVQHHFQDPSRSPTLEPVPIIALPRAQSPTTRHPL